MKLEYISYKQQHILFKEVVDEFNACDSEKKTLWIVTGDAQTLGSEIAALSRNGVYVRLLCRKPSDYFLLNLYSECDPKFLDIRLCQRSHAKIIFVNPESDDGSVYLGSSNLTRASLGSRAFNVNYMSKNHEFNLKICANSEKNEFHRFVECFMTDIQDFWNGKYCHSKGCIFFEKVDKAKKQFKTFNPCLRKGISHPSFSYGFINKLKNEDLKKQFKKAEINLTEVNENFPIKISSRIL